MIGSEDIAIRYVLSYVDKGTGRALARDQEIRASAKQTGTALRASGTAAKTAAGQVSAASATEVSALARAQAAALRTNAAFERSGRGLIAFGGRAKAASHSLSLLSAPLLAIGAVSAKAAVDFQANMEKIHTQAGATQKEVGKLTKEVLAFSKSGKAAQGPNELAKGLYHLESLGLRGSKAMHALKTASEGAAVGGAPLEETASALGAAWRVNIKGAGSFDHVMGNLNATVGTGNVRLGDLVHAFGTGILPTAKLAGLSLTDVTGALSVFTDEGTNASSAAANLRTALHFLYAPGNKATDALASVGLNSKQLAEDMHKPDGLLTALTDLHDHLGRLKGGASGVDAAQTLSRIFPAGRGAVLLTLMNQLGLYSQKIDTIKKNTSNFGEAVSKTQQTAAFKIHAAWSTIEADGVQLGGHVLPAMVPAIQEVSHVIQTLSDDFDGLSGHQKRMVLEIIAGVALLGPSLRILGGLSKLVGGGVVGVSKISRFMLAGPASRAASTGAAGGLSTAAVSGSLDALAAAADRAAFALGEMTVGGGLARTPGGVILPPGVKGVGAAVPAAESGALGLGESAAPAALGATLGPKLLTVGSNLMRGGLIAGIGYATSKLAGSAIGGSTGGAVSAIGGDAAIGAGIGTAVAPGIGTAIGGIGGAIIGGIVHFLGHQGPTVRQAVDSLFKASGSAVRHGITEIQVSGHERNRATNYVQNARNLQGNLTTRIPTPRGIGAGRGGGGSGIPTTGIDPVTAGLDKGKIQRYYRDAGLIAVRAFQTATTKGPQFTTSGVLYKGFNAQLKAIPNQYRDAAAASMIAYAVTLEQQGRIPIGAAAKLMGDLEKTYSGLPAYLAAQGTTSIKLFNDSLKDKKVLRTAQQTVDGVSKYWADFPRLAKLNGGNARDEFATAISFMKSRVLTSTGQMKLRAEYDLQLLEGAASKWGARSKTDLVDAFKNAKTGVFQQLDDLKTVGSSAMHGVGNALSTALGDALHLDLSKLLAGLPSKPDKAGAAGDSAGQAAAGTPKTPKPKKRSGTHTTTVTGSWGSGFAGGGWVPGSPYMDGTPAMLSGNEFVMTDSGQSMMNQAAPGLLNFIAGNQAPHFKKGGFVAADLNAYNKQYAANGGAQISPTAVGNIAYSYGLPRAAMTQIAHGESNYEPGAVESPEKSGAQGFGLWQITTKVGNDAMIAALGGVKAMLNPLINAQAAKKLYDSGGLSPWHGTRYLTAAAIAAAKSGKDTGTQQSGPSSTTVITAPTEKDPFYAGYQRGLVGGHTLGRALVHSLLPGRKTIDVSPSNTANPTAPGTSASIRSLEAAKGTTTPNTTWNPRKKPIANWIVPILRNMYNAGAQFTVESGFRTYAEQVAIVASGVKPAAKPGTSNHEGSTFPRGAVDVKPGQGSLNSHLLASKYSKVLVYAGKKDPVHFSHPHGGSYRRGGFVGARRFAAGGFAGAGATAGSGLGGNVISQIGAMIGRMIFGTGAKARIMNVASSGDSSTSRFVALDKSLSSLTYQHVHALADWVKTQIDDLKKHPSAKSASEVGRLSSVLRLLDAEMGRKVGVIVNNAEKAQHTVARRNLQLGVMQAGKDPSSSGELGLAATVDQLNMNTQRAALDKLHSALTKAEHAHNTKAVTEIKGLIDQQQDAVTQAYIDWMNAVADAAKAKIGESLDAAQRQVTAAGSAEDMLAAQQRLAGTDQSPAGMQQQAGMIAGSEIPALQRLLIQQQQAAGQYGAIGDTTDRQAALDAAAQTTVQIVQRMADAADLMKQAAASAAATAVAFADHNETMAEGGLTTLQLHQQITDLYNPTSGPTGADAQASADYITNTVIPSIQADISALRDQQNVATAQGDSALAQQIAEAIQGKQNQILQDQLDALQGIKDATQQTAQALDQAGGSLGFDFNNQGFTDMIGLGTGL